MMNDVQTKVNQLYNQVSMSVAQGTFPHGILIECQNEVEGEAFASYIANCLVCRSNQKPCGVCPDCVKAQGKGHPDIFTTDGKKGKSNTFSVDAIREIRDDAFIIPNESDKKIYVLKNGQNMNEQSQNAILKILEEPPSYVFFIIVTTSKSTMLETVLSRVQVFSLLSDEEKITEKTKAIMVVHLYGAVAQMDKIVALCKKYNLRLIEDCAQSHGACYNGQMTGTFGDVGCFSFYPSKNLGAFGDAGAIVTNDPKLAEEFKVYRNYGSEKRYYNKVVGANSRLDEMQAGLLRVRLPHMEELTAQKQAIADRYTRELKNPLFVLPEARENSNCVWHQYVIRCEERDRLIAYLDEKGIGTIIHYPIPPHLSEAYQYLGHKEGFLPITERYAQTVLSIPMYNGMTEEEQTYVIDALNAFA